MEVSADASEPLLDRILQSHTSHSSPPAESVVAESRADAVEGTTTSDDSSSGSSVGGAIFNFTNAMIGAGCLGLGSAMARSGGLVSVITLLVFAWLFKLSLDLLIALSLRHGAGTYEELALRAMGPQGRLGIMASKFLYSFGCLVAYVVVIEDNLGPAMKSLLYGNDNRSPEEEDTTLSYLERLLADEALVTWTVAFFVMLPLCLLRDMTPLSTFSIVSVFGMMTIVGIVIYLYASPTQSPSIRHPGEGTLYEHWFQIRPAYLECLGTFVFTYASQHVVHLAFKSLKPELQTLDHWRRISRYAIGMSATVSTTVGLFVYMTFWEATESDIFDVYPSIPIVNLAKTLLCLTLVLTFPMPFFTCRELFWVFVTTIKCDCSAQRVDGDDEDHADMPWIETTPSKHDNPDDPLLEIESCSMDDSTPHHQRSRTRHVRISSFHQSSIFRQTCFGADEEESRDTNDSTSHDTILPRAGWRARIFLSPADVQLKLPYHFLWTFGMWFTVVYLAIAAPNLGDVLNVVGCATGSLIAFLFPGAIAYLLEGYSWEMVVIFGVGLFIFPVGTFFSVKTLLEDLHLIIH